MFRFSLRDFIGAQCISLQQNVQLASILWTKLTVPPVQWVTTRQLWATWLVHLAILMQPQTVPGPVPALTVVSMRLVLCQIHSCDCDQCEFPIFPYTDVIMVGVPCMPNTQDWLLLVFHVHVCPTHKSDYGTCSPYVQCTAVIMVSVSCMPNTQVWLW